jgi:hypothetical protein
MVWQGRGEKWWIQDETKCAEVKLNIKLDPRD